MNRRRALEQKWAALRFGTMKVETDGEQHVFEIEVYLDDLDPAAVRVELYANGAGEGLPVRQEMQRLHSVDARHDYVYRARVPAVRPTTGYTARLIPRHDGVAVPLEAARILWQR